MSHTPGPLDEQAAEIAALRAALEEMCGEVERIKPGKPLAFHGNLIQAVTAARAALAGASAGEVEQSHDSDDREETPEEMEEFRKFAYDRELKNRKVRAFDWLAETGIGTLQYIDEQWQWAAFVVPNGSTMLEAVEAAAKDGAHE